MVFSLLFLLVSYYHYLQFMPQAVAQLPIHYLFVGSSPLSSLFLLSDNFSISTLYAINRKDTAEPFYFLIPNLFPSFKEFKSTHKILFYSYRYFLLIFSILLLLP